MLRLGVDNETKSPVELSPDNRRQGTYIAGVNVTGKTILLMNTALSDAEVDDGLCFLDPHGDAVEALLTLIHEHRKKDVKKLSISTDTFIKQAILEKINNKNRIKDIEKRLFI